MKKITAIGVIGVLACSLIGVSAGPKEDIEAAAKKLKESGYSWKSTMEIANSQFNMGPTEGKYAKDGTICVTRTFNDRTMETIVKGEKSVTKGENGWQTPEEMSQGGGRGFGRGGAAMMRQHPAVQIENVLADIKDLKESGGAYTADLTESGAKKLLTFGRGGRGGGGAGGGQTPPEPKNAKGFVKFWLKDGNLTKYVQNVQGTVMGRNNEEQERDVTTTVEIKDVGTTKVEVPAEAKSKLQ